MKSKRKFSSEFKAKVAIEALKEQSTLSEMSMKTPEKSREEEVDALYKKIGELQIANDFLKKSCRELQ